MALKADGPRSEHRAGRILDDGLSTRTIGAAHIQEVSIPLAHGFVRATSCNLPDLRWHGLVGSIAPDLAAADGP